MSYGKHLSRQMKDPAFVSALAQESLITDIQEEICRLMQEKGISRNDLAKKMGKSKSFVTQILNSGRNLTLCTVANIFTALGTQLTVKAKTKKVETVACVQRLY